MHLPKLSVPIGILCCLPLMPQTAAAQAAVDLTEYNASRAVAISQPDANTLTAEWTDQTGAPFRLRFNLTAGQPLLREIEASSSAGGSLAKVADAVDPRYRVTLGSRVPKTSWPHIFFERIDTNTPAPASFLSELDMSSVRVVSESPNRVKLVFSTLRINTYSGDLTCYIYSGSPMVQFQASMNVTQPWVSYIFDSLFYADVNSITYKDTNGAIQTRSNAAITATVPGTAASVNAKHRTIMAAIQGGSGTLAAMGPPHTSVYPTDFSNNFGFLQAGKTFFGTRMSPNADNRYRPWINAPEGATQKMDVFLLIGAGAAAPTLDRVLTYTNGDFFKSIPGYYKMVVHFHPEIVMSNRDDGRDTITPFKQAMQAVGIQIAQPQEFHGPGHPFGNMTDRLAELREMFQTFEANSDSSFLFIPGEEYNNFFGGHWSYMFPKPVYFTGWSGQGTREYKQTNVVSGGITYPTVYQIGDSARMLQLLRDEGGLAWAAHPRVKGSRTQPDSYVNSNFYRDPLFQTGGWKAMPADFSKDRLGYRSFDLMDDTAQWGYRKYQLGETDTFELTPGHEIYSHLNVNYMQLPGFPSKTDWTTVVNSIRNGQFFNTTGEVLIHSCEATATGVTADVEWYFPPAFAEITWGTPAGIQKLKQPLAELTEFGRQQITIAADLTGADWVRFEFWDVARNGAFTQPHWLHAAPEPTVVAGRTTGFTLMNTDTDSPVPGYDPIPPGTVLNRALLPANLTIRANVSPWIMDSVNVVLDGVTVSRTQWPYCLSSVTTGTGVGDSPAYDFAAATLGTGAHSISATPFRGAVAGTPLSLAFSVTGTPPPVVPAGLAAAPGNRQVTLTWTPVAGATSYNIKRSANAAGPYATLANPVSPNHVDTNLTNGIPVYYRVSSVAASESANSAPVTATPGNVVSLIEHFTQGDAANADVPINAAPGWHALGKSSGGVVTDYSNSIPQAKNSPNIADNTAGAAGTTGYLVVGLNTVVNPVLAWVDTAGLFQSSVLSSVGFYTKNGSAANTERVAVRIGGSWYVSAQTYSDMGTNSVWTEQNFTFSNSASAWLPLNITTLVLGAPLATPLPAGEITGVGLYCDIIGEKIRMDEFKITTGIRSPFQLWQIGNYGGIDAPGAGPNIIPGGDGIYNLMRYALNLNSTESTAGHLPVVGKVNVGGVNYLSISYTALKGASGIDYVVEVCNDLATWQSGPAVTTPVSTVSEGPDTNLVTVRDNVPIPADNHRFIRVRAILPAG
ncbi:MAG: hypothetical protein V4689_21150 [Verrucomicrobiota bacterium]